MNSKLAVLALLCVVAAIGGWLLLFRGSAASASAGPAAADEKLAPAPTPAPASAPDAAEDAPPSTSMVGPVPAGPVRLTPPTPLRTPSDRSRMLSLPDGTFVPALNGAVSPPAMTWEPGRPWSPIVGREIDTFGKEWYVHGDGTKTITQMVWRSDLGREDGMTSVNHPRPPGTLVDGSGAPVVPGGKPPPDGKVGPRKM